MNPGEEKKRPGHCARAFVEGALLEREAEGALKDTRITVRAADHAKGTYGLIHGGRRAGEVRMVSGVEGIPAELEGLSFPQSPVLHDRCIDAKDARSPVGVLAGVAEAAPSRRIVVTGGGKDEGGRVEVALGRVNPCLLYTSTRGGILPMAPTDPKPPQVTVLP